MLPSFRNQSVIGRPHHARPESVGWLRPESEPPFHNRAGRSLVVQGRINRAQKIVFGSQFNAGQEIEEKWRLVLTWTGRSLVSQGRIPSPRRNVFRSPQSASKTRNGGSLDENATSSIRQISSRSPIYFLDVQLFQKSIGGRREFCGKSAVYEIGQRTDISDETICG
jgi:hypothetical protein